MEETLDVPVDLARDLIRLARAFEAAIPLDAADFDDDMSGEEAREALADYVEDPTYLELQGFLGSLTVGEQVGLVALAWIGRGTFAPDEWEEAIDEARVSRDEGLADQLLGMPQLATHLEDGLDALDLAEEE